MKLLLVLIAVLLIPFIIEADATHLPQFSGGQYTDEFYWQEIDIGDGTDQVGRCEEHRYSAGFYLKVSESDGTQGNCAIFKSFDVEDIDGKDVNNSFSWGRQTGTQTYPSYKIYDGTYIGGDSGDFPDNGGIAIQGAGKLYDSGTLGNGCGLGDCSPNTINADLSAGTQPQATIFFGYLYDSAFDGDTSFNIGSSFSIEDLGSFRFCSGGSNSLCDNARPIETGGSGNNEWGKFFSYNPLPSLGHTGVDNFYNGTSGGGMVTDFSVTPISDQEGIETGILVGQLDFTTQSENSHEQQWSANGTKYFVLENADDEINEFDCTPFLVDTCVFNSLLDIGGDGATSPTGMAWKPDGTVMLIFDLATLDLFQYDCSPDDVSSCIFIDSDNSTSTQSPDRALAVSPDGTKLFNADQTNDEIDYYTCTAWTNNCTYQSSFAVGTHQDTIQGLEWYESGLGLFIVGNGAVGENWVTEYSCTTPHILTSCTHVQDWVHDLPQDVMVDIDFNDDETKMYLMENADDITYEFDLSGNLKSQFDWTIPSQDADHGIPITDFILEYKEGSSNESDEWKLIAKLGVVDTYTSVFTAGHDYTARITTVGIQGQLSDHSSEETWTQTGTPSETQTYDVLDRRNGMDNRFYFREVGIYSSDTQFSRAKCTTVGFSGDRYVAQFGSIASGDYGVCYHMIKSFDHDAVDGNELSFTGTYGRTSGTATYVTNYLYDGCYDVWNGDTFRHYQGIAGFGAGVLFSDTTPTDHTWTPDLSSATQDCVTYMSFIRDDAPGTSPPAGGSGGTANGQIERFSINTGSQATTWYIPPSGTMQSNYPDTDYITGETFDWGWADALFPMHPITDLSGSFTYPDGTLQWSTGETRFGPVTNYKLERQCDTDPSFEVIASNQYYNPLAEQTGGIVETITDPNLKDLFLDAWEFTDPADFPFDFSDGTGWVATDEVAPYYFRVDDVTDQQFEFDIFGSSSINIYYDLGAGTLDGDQWVLRYQLYFDEYGITGANNHFFWGISDTPTGNLGTVSQDFLGTRWTTGSSDQRMYAQAKDGGTLTSVAMPDWLAIPDVAQIPYYIETARHNATSFTVSVYSDPQYETLVDSEDIDLTGKTINGLRYLKATMWDFSSGDQPMAGLIDDYHLWVGTDIVTGMSPIVDPDPYLFCDYKVTEDSDISDSVSCCEEESNTFRLSFEEQEVGGAVCLDISDSQLIFDWERDEFGEDLQGYGIQQSLDDVTFVSQIDNTFNPDLSQHLISGLDDGTLYYFQHRNMFFNGTQGDWSTSYQCTTLQGGGGGTPTPDPVCTLQQLLDPDHECFEPVDECTPITSFEIITGRENSVNIGMTSHNELGALWSGNDNLRIDEIVPDETTGIKLAFQQPIEFPPGIAGITTSNIPYTIQNPPVECTNEQTASCVYQNAEYEIPVKIFGNSCQQDFRADSTIIVTIRDDQPFDFRLLLLAIIGMFLIFFIIAKRKKKKKRGKLSTKSRSRSKQIKQNTKPNLGR